VRLAAVQEADQLDLTRTDLLIVGSPTRGFRPTPHISSYVGSLDRVAPGKLAAAFDTRLDLDAVKPEPLKWVIDVGGYAASRIAASLERHGFLVRGGLAGFLVESAEGPLKDGEIAGDDAIRLAAGEIAEESWLLCFDEFHVTDIADAMILGRLFARLFELDVVVVATSNVAPSELYRDGLNRSLFVPFIAMIERHMQVLRLEARTDFRLEKLAGQKVWYVPADDAAAAALDQAWRRLVGSSSGMPQELAVKGRKLRASRNHYRAPRDTPAGGREID